MPELPDLEAYLTGLRSSFVGQRLHDVRLKSPFLLRTFNPRISSLRQRSLVGVSRLGKRLIFDFGEQLYLCLHLMIAGRLHARQSGAKLGGKATLLALDFENQSLVLTEAGSKRRASLHLVQGDEALRQLDRGGIDPVACSLDEFVENLSRENRTLKRALTDPRLLSGIGNAYSDEILWCARLSPVMRTASLTEQQWLSLYHACRTTLSVWRHALAPAPEAFPEKVSAFRTGMAVHGRFGQPCPFCNTKVQRIRLASNEMNYCPRCQTRGKLLRDRSLSLLLKRDFPRSIEELEEFERSKIDGPSGT